MLGTLMAVRAAARYAALPCVLLFTSITHAQDRSGVRPEVLQVPSGPGSIEGLGEAFEPSPQSGSSSYAIPLRVPPGVAGFVPSLALRYSSGSGNGPMGIGWSLGQPVVQRGTDRRLPRYDDTDVFVLRGMGAGGAEDLVRMPDGSYRFRIEGAFVRGNRIADGTWEFRNPSGARFVFGERDATLRDGERVFQWCLTRQEDTLGNAIDYEYEHDDTGYPYLRRVVYNDFSDAVRNVVEFEYEGRGDAITSYLPTFPFSIARRLRSVHMRHGDRDVFDYTFEYETELGLSRLVAVGFSAADGTTLPSVQLEYASFAGGEALVTMTEAPARALGTVAELNDVNGDALPDLLVMDPSLDDGAYSWYQNLDGHSFAPRTTMAESPSVWLDSLGVQLADMDGDGAADVVARLSSTEDGFRYYPGGAGDGFGAAVTISPNPSFSLEDPSVRLLDLDHDRLTDWLKIDPSTGDAWVAYNRGGGQFTTADSLGPIDPDEVISFESGLQLSDMNGDGLSDLVSIRSQSLRYWPSLGLGRFDRPIDLTGAPELSDDELSDVMIRDLNGDGQADMIAVGVSQVRYWINLAGGGLDEVRTLAEVPTRTETTVVRTADMNGNGSADIVWVDSANDSAPWSYLDVLADGAPGLLTRVDNGLGKVTHIQYTGLGEMRGWAREQDVPWTHCSSVGQHVVAAVEVDDSLGQRYVTRYHYANPYFDATTREWRGFSHVQQLEPGDEEQPTLATRLEFDVGELEEARKGLPLLAERATENGALFDRTTTEHVVRTVGTAADGTELRFTFVSGTRKEVYELGDDPKVLLTETDRDDFGNVVFEANYGEVLGDDLAHGDDEVITERAFAINEEAWIVGALAWETTRSFSGDRVAESRTYYDGEAFDGLPLGEVSHGLVTRSESWIEGERYGLDAASKYDEYGNAVVVRDARDGVTEITYDAEAHTFPVLVTRQSSTSSDDMLTWEAQHDSALGLMTELTDEKGQQYRFVHDGLGRLLVSIAPLDNEEYPTLRYEYALAAPISFVRIEQRENHNEPGTMVSYSYVDGLGRERGTFEEAPDNRWGASGLVEYGARGQVSFKAHPRWASSADFTEANAPEGGVHVAYDALGRVLQETEIDGAVRRTQYAPLGVHQWDENDTNPESAHFDTPTSRWSDGLERLRRIVERDADSEAITTFDYDALSNLTRVTDAEGSVRTYQFDGRKRQTGVVEPNAGTWTYEYNDANDLVKRVDGQGNIVDYEFDLLGRPLKEWHLGHDADERELQVEYHYDSPHEDFRHFQNTRGELTWVNDAAGEVHFGYDERGRVTDTLRRWSDGVEHHSEARFDAADRPTRTVYPDGSSLDYRYDERGLIESVGGIVEDARWTAWKALEQVRYGNGVSDEHIYDSRQRLSQHRATHDAKVLRDLSYTFDAASQILGVSDARADVEPDLALTERYAYDDRYRLVTAEDSLATTTWTLDRVGKIMAVSSGHDQPFLNVVNRYGEDGAGPDQLTHFGDERIRYDAAGRVVEDGERKLTWDAKGRLSRVERGDVVEEYVYAHDDSRALKRTTAGGETEVVRYISSDAEERDGTLIRYVNFDGRRVVKPSVPTWLETASPWKSM